MTFSQDSPPSEFWIIENNNEDSNSQDGCWYGYSDRCSRSFEEATTMVAGERVARACGPGVLVQEPTDYVKARGMGSPNGMPG